MTISSSVRLAGPYTGTGSVSTYPFAFKVFQASDVLVKQTDLSGNITTLALTTDYSVSLSSDQNANPGGSVSLNSPLPNGYQLVISSQVPETQGTSLTNNGGFYPGVIENALDYLTILVQQAQTYLSNALQLPITVTGVSTTLPTPQGSQLIGWNAAGTALVNTSPTGVGAGTITGGAVGAGGNIAASTITDLNIAANAAIAGTKINFVQAGTGAVARDEQSKARERVTVADYRLAADPDDTLAFTRAINAWNSLGVRFRIPAGTYTVSSALPAINYSAGTTETYAAKINIQGDGADCTVINYTGTTGSLFTIQGGQNSSIVSHATFSGFLINGPGSGTTTTGLTITNMARGCFRDVVIYGFGTGFTATDILSSVFDNFHVNQCGTVGTLAKSTFSEPNAIRWTGCQFGQNLQGLYVNGAVTNTFDGCIFEGNGQATTGYQLKIVPGTDGYASFSMNGCYFEGGYGLADVLVSAASYCTMDIENTQFNRLSSTQFVTNNISITSTASVSAKIDRCGFLGGGTYTPNSGRPYIAISAPSYVIDGGRNGYSSLTEKPNLSNSPGIVPAAMPNAWARFAGTTGVVSRSFNVASVTRTGTGVYNIVINQLGPSGFNTYAVSLSSPGYWAITGESGSTVTLSTFNTSGVAADIGVVGFTMFGGADTI